jgi:hypothetical protein
MPIPRPKQAIGEVIRGTAWHRWRVYLQFMRNLLAYVPKRGQATAAAVGRTSCQQTSLTDAEAARERVVDALAAASPKVVELLLDAEGELFRFDDFLRSIAVRSGARTRWSDAPKSSSAAAPWPAFFLTGRRSSACSARRWASSTMSGWWDGTPSASARARCASCSHPPLKRRWRRSPRRRRHSERRDTHGGNSHRLTRGSNRHNRRMCRFIRLSTGTHGCWVRLYESLRVP